MNIELDTLSIDELQDISKRLDRELKSRQSREKKAANKEQVERRRQVLRQIRELATAHGLSVEEVLKNRGRSPTGERALGSKSPPKYRNPQNEDQTWTGKGRKPGWVLAALNQGQKLEDMAISE